ncbi:MAG: hypothetical protein ACRDU9_05690 [Acidimicrobiia bacterium]
MGDLRGLTVIPIQPYQAVKEYICPGCEHIIAPGTFHLVVIPDESVDMRRHWHHGCWHKELRKGYGAQASRR